MFKLFQGKKKDENVERFEVDLVCPDRSLGLQIDGKSPPFKVRPTSPPASKTEIKEGNALIGIDDWIFDSKTDIDKVLDRIRTIMGGPQPVIKLLLQRDKGERPKPIGATWTCERCTVANAMNQDICDVCGMKKVESMNRLKAKMKPKWKCSSCTYENLPTKDKCIICEAPNTANDEPIEVAEMSSFGQREQMSSTAQLAMALKLSMNEHKDKGQPEPVSSVSENAPYQPPQMNQGPPAGMQPNPYAQPMMAQQPLNYQPMGGYPMHQGNQPIAQYYQPGQQMGPGPQMAQPMYQLNYAANPSTLQPIPEPEPQVKEPSPKPQKERTPEPEKPKPMWQCALCTTKNRGDSMTCTTCNAPRLSKKSNRNAKSGPLAPELVGVSVRREKVQVALWKCPYCAYENTGGDEQCLMCSRDRPMQGDFGLRVDPKEALETADRQKIAMTWLQKQLILENHCRVADLDAAFRRSDNRITEAVFRITSGFKNLDMFKGKLERFIGGQVGSMKRMGTEMEGRLYKVTNELQKVAKRYQETTDFMNLTQQELEEKSYLEQFTTKLNSLNAQEENLQKQLEELRAKKDKVTLQMRSAAINKKLQFENCERVVKQLKDQLAALGAEKNELDVQNEIIRQQVNNYTEMRRGLANVKLNDLKSTIRVFEQEQYAVDYSEINNTQSERRNNTNQKDRPIEHRSPVQKIRTSPIGAKYNQGRNAPNINLGQSAVQQSAGTSNAHPPSTEVKEAEPLDIFSELMQPSKPAQPTTEVQTDLL